LIQQIGVRLLVDFALQDLLGALHSQSRDFAAQCFACLHDLLVRVGLRLRNDARSFGLCVSLDFVGDSDRPLFSVGNTLLAVGAGLCEFLVDALVRGFEFRLALFGGCQSVGDLFLRVRRGR
jgi:hypothetical protein